MRCPNIRDRSHERIARLALAVVSLISHHGRRTGPNEPNDPSSATLPYKPQATRYEPYEPNEPYEPHEPNGPLRHLLVVDVELQDLTPSPIPTPSRVPGITTSRKANAICVLKFESNGLHQRSAGSIEPLRPRQTRSTWDGAASRASCFSLDFPDLPSGTTPGGGSIQKPRFCLVPSCLRYPERTGTPARAQTQRRPGCRCPAFS